MDEHLKTIEGVIDRLEGGKAVIRLDDGQEIIWPREKLWGEASSGSAIRLLALSDRELTEQKEQIARDMLKEIFKSDD